MQSHSRWLYAIRKRVITEKKRGVKKYMKIRNCFCKYAIQDDQVALIPN